MIIKRYQKLSFIKLLATGCFLMAAFATVSESYHAADDSVTEWPVLIFAVFIVILMFILINRPTSQK